MECWPSSAYQARSLQKVFQKKSRLKVPKICKMIAHNQVVHCTSERTLDFEFQNGDVLIQCRLTIATPSQPTLEEEARMVEEFDVFIRSFATL